MTSLAYRYYTHDHARVYANYHLTKIPYTPIDFKTLATLPDDLYDAVVFLDEIQVGADAYEIFKRSNKAITTFATQLRKRRITLYYSTQVFTMATKRLRQQTNYIIECWATSQNGVIDIRVFDRALPYQEQLIKEFVLDGRPFFSHYDTDEVITFEKT